MQHVWIDAQSFLDVKVEGTPRRMDGKMRTVWVYQRDFRSVQGLMVPFVLETAVDGYRDTHKMAIEKVALNPGLNDSLFAQAEVVRIDGDRRADRRASRFGLKIRQRF